PCASRAAGRRYPSSRPSEPGRREARALHCRSSCASHLSIPNSAISNCQATSKNPTVKNFQDLTAKNLQDLTPTNLQHPTAANQLGVGSWESLGSWALRSWKLSPLSRA